MNVKGLLHLISMMYLAFDCNVEDMAKLDVTYSGKVTENKVKHKSISGKGYTQNPYIKSHQGYHNKTIPRGCRESRISLYGQEVKIKNKLKKKGLEKRLD